MLVSLNTILLSRFMELERLEKELVRKADVLENPAVRAATELLARKERRRRHPEGKCCNFVMPPMEVGAATAYFGKAGKMLSWRQEKVSTLINGLPGD